VTPIRVLRWGCRASSWSPFLGGVVSSHLISMIWETEAMFLACLAASVWASVGGLGAWVDEA
jgi:hypothetical protein